MPILIANPAADREFVEFAEAALAQGRRTPDELQAALRARYPSAVVRPRELSAEHTHSWYVYRDGHWVSDEATGTRADAQEALGQ